MLNQRTMSVKNSCTILFLQYIHQTSICFVLCRKSQTEYRLKFQQYSMPGCQCNVHTLLPSCFITRHHISKPMAS